METRWMIYPLFHTWIKLRTQTSCEFFEGLFTLMLHYMHAGALWYAWYKNIDRYMEGKKLPHSIILITVFVGFLNTVLLMKLRLSRKSESQIANNSYYLVWASGYYEDPVCLITVVFKSKCVTEGQCNYVKASKLFCDTYYHENLYERLVE